MKNTIRQNLIKFLLNRYPLWRFIVWFGLANTILFWIIGSRYLMIMLTSKTFYTTHLDQAASLTTKITAYLFTFLSFTGQMNLLALLPLMLIVPIVFLFPRKFIILPLAILLGTLSILLLISDTIVYSLYHFHINATILQLVYAERYGLREFFNLSTLEAYSIAIISVFFLLLEIILAVLIWKKIITLKRFHFVGIKIVACLNVTLGLSYLAFLISITQANNAFAAQTFHLPLYNYVFSTVLPIKLNLLNKYSEKTFSQPLYPEKPLQYPLHTLQCQAKTKPYNIVIIGVDTWRFDALNSLLTPNLIKFAKNNWYFKHHLSGGNATQPGLFSLFYSLPPSYWNSILKKQQGAELIHQLLKNNYQMQISLSADMHTPPFDKTIFSELSSVRQDTAPGTTIPDKDRYTTNEFINFLKNRNPTKPFFSFIFYDSVHGYCGTQNFKKVLTNKNDSDTCMRITASKDMFIRYKNAVHFIDEEINKVLLSLQQAKLLDNTVIIITSDHGEEFDDNATRYWGHGSNYSRYQIQVPLLIHWPKQEPKTFEHLTSHYDIVPLLLKNILHCTNPVKDYSIGENLLQVHQTPYLLAGSYFNMGIVEAKEYITLLSSGHFEVSDNKTNLLLDKNPDKKIIADALLKMRQFYHP